MAERGVVARQLFLRTMMRSFNPSRAVESASASEALAGQMRDLVVPAGGTIYRRGEAPERLYFVVSGTVVLRAEGLQDWELGPRSIIGVIDVNLERPRLRTAIAKTDVHLLWIRAEDYFETLEDNFEQTRGVSYGLCHGLREIVDALGPSGGQPEQLPEGAPAAARSLDPVEQIFALRAVPAFARASIQALTSLAGLAEELHVEPGQRLAVTTGREAALVVVARGAVELSREHPPLVARFGAGMIAGGIAMLGNDDPRLSIRPLVRSILLRLREEDYFDVMEENFDLARALWAHGALEL
ncbi:cyclic nucleotide-binding domain-containing protein, partial [Myxococcota bacterium]|nr:cyclic nucleotide-binding domain-containing protein [Myxococcota bacterium]